MVVVRPTLGAIAVLLAIVFDGVNSRGTHWPKSLSPRPARPTDAAGHPGSGNCTTHWFTQDTDHFSFAPPPPGYPATFQERYFVCHNGVDPTKAKAIWFYCGNEADVELYVNATGLMWENSAAHDAVMVFAEHRYYGETVISGPTGSPPVSTPALRYLTMEQALADYATIIRALPDLLGTAELPVIAFGGSYGGMLAAWLRMKYPGSIAGSIAASAPILAFPGMTPPYDSNSYWQVVTRDATPDAGATKGCDSNVRAAFSALWNLGASESGRAQLQSSFKVCKTTPVTTANDVQRLAFMMLNAWDTMAMGNFPFASDYLVFQQTGNSAVTMPPFPVRVACEFMTNYTSKTEGDVGDAALLAAMQRASGVLYNVTQTEECLELPDDPNYDGIWDYQYCSELLPQETYFTLDGQKDMFWARPMNMSAIDAHCREVFGFAPRADWIATEFGGMEGVRQASNIVFSSGLYDPWSSGGVGVAEAVASGKFEASFGVDGSVTAVVLPHGAHHLDLMFHTAQDPADAIAARSVELQSAAKWAKEWTEQRSQNHTNE